MSSVLPVCEIAKVQLQQFAPIARWPSCSIPRTCFLLDSGSRRSCWPSTSLGSKCLAACTFKAGCT
eukprot:1664961-Amphidinium_carterae.1